MASDIIIQVDDKTTDDSAGGWLDTITDLNFGSPGGTVTVTFTRDVTLNSTFTAVPNILDKTTTLLQNTTVSDLLDNQTQWVVYYPFQTIHGAFGFIGPGGFTTFKNALLNLTGGLSLFTTGYVFKNAGLLSNFWLVGPGGTPPTRQWGAWVPHGGFSGSFRGTTAAASIAQDYSNFLNEGYPNPEIPGSNGATASSICDHVQRERVMIKIKVPHVSTKPAFSVTFSGFDNTIQLTQDIVSLNPKKPATMSAVQNGLTRSYFVSKA